MIHYFTSLPFPSPPFPSRGWLADWVTAVAPLTTLPGRCYVIPSLSLCRVTFQGPEGKGRKDAETHMQCMYL